MKIRVAIVCAFNPWNSGMYSVDSAASRLMKKLGYEHELFLAQTPVSRILKLKKYLPSMLLQHNRLSYGQHTFKRLKNVKQLHKFTHVLYWGDFINNPIYGLNDFSHRDVQFGLSDSREQGAARWLELFTPVSLPGHIKLASIGNNFQNLKDDNDTFINESLQRLLDNFDLVMPRDELSTENVKKHENANTKATIQQGLDCAFLLQTEKPQKRMLEENKKFISFFHRSKISNLSELITRISDIYQLEVGHLDNWLKLQRDTAQSEFDTNINKMLNAEFVVTDTYHVCVNAMRLGVPVIGIGVKCSAQVGTLGDFKKKKLFEMFDNSDNYIELDENTISENECNNIIDILSVIIEKNQQKYAIVKVKTDDFIGVLENFLQS